MNILCIDPGTTKSGWCVLSEKGDVIEHGWADNEELLTKISRSAMLTIIEDVAHYGMPVGKEVFETVKWMGRFDANTQHVYINRPEVKLALCGSPRANDSTIRQAVIDHYGGDSVAIGGKKCVDCKGKGWKGRDHTVCESCHHQTVDKAHPPKCETVGCGYETHPGQLHGVSGHVWSALAVGITYLKQVSN